PVHPLAEALRAASQLARRPDDDVAALLGELLEAVLLDLPLRVQPELTLDADLDPQPLAVEAVLVALVEAPQRLVALEDVLQRPPPRRVHVERLARGHRAVDERPVRPAPVLRPEPLERPLPLPQLEHRDLDRGMIGLVGELREHVSIVAFCVREETIRPRRLKSCKPPLKGTDGH